MNCYYRQDFIDKANHVIVRFGGMPDGDHYHWKLETRLGLLRLHVDEDLNGFGVGTVYTQFEEVQRAFCEVSCELSSGKWNHHYITDWTVKEAIDDLTFWLRSVMQ